MRDVIETHLDECTAAMDAQNKAIEAAQIELVNATENARKAFDDAVQRAQDTYGKELQRSRDNAWAIIQKRLSVWNGEAKDLPATEPLAIRSVEEDPTGLSA